MMNSSEIVNALHAATCHPDAQPFWTLFRAAAEHIEALDHGEMERVALATANGELRSELLATHEDMQRRSRMLNEVGDALERACCNGEGYHPDYGWPVGEHIPDMMADAIINKRKQLQRDLDAALQENARLKR